MRRKAHHLMWPGKLYIDDWAPSAPGIDSRGQLQMNTAQNAAKMPAPNAAKVPAPKTTQMPGPNAAEMPTPNAAKVPASNAAKMPAPNAAKVPAPNAAEIPAPNAAKVPAPNAAKVPAPNADVPVPNAAEMPAPNAAKVPSPNAAKMPATNAAKVSAPNAAEMPAPNAVKASAQNAGSPGRPVDEAREPYRPSVKPAAQYFTQVGQSYTAGVRYEPARPVKDAVRRFERKYNWTVHSPNRPQPWMGSREQLQMKPEAKIPAVNAAKVSASNAGSPGRQVGATREP